MARAKFISDFERDVIRIGVSRGVNAPQIARFLGRTKVAVYQQIAAMDAAGALESGVLPFVADEIANAIKKA
jgi:hypothetical protein